METGSIRIAGSRGSKINANPTALYASAEVEFKHQIDSTGGSLGMSFLRDRIIYTEIKIVIKASMGPGNHHGKGPRESICA